MPDKMSHSITVSTRVISNRMTSPSRVVNFDRFIAPFRHTGRLHKGDSTVPAILPSSTGERLLEVEPELSRQRARRHIVRPAEGREEVIERQFVGDVDGGKRETPFVTFAFKLVVVAHRNIEQITRRNARRIVVVIFSSGCRYL
jgi:hypothetical protein